MSWCIKARIINNRGKDAVIGFPTGDNKMSEILRRLGHGAMETRAVISEIQPKELVSLCGGEHDLDELNYLAKYMDDLDERYLEIFLAAMEVSKPKTAREAINMMCNLNCYSLAAEGKSLSEIGRDFIMDRDGSMPLEEYNNRDFSDIGQKLLDSGEGQQTSHGILFRTGNEPHIEYDGTVFPPYFYGMPVFDVWLKHGEKEEMIQLPCDDIAIDKVLRRLGANSLDDCNLTIVEDGIRSFDWLDELEAGDIRELNRFAGLCKNYYTYDYNKIVSVMEYAKLNDLDSAITIAQNIGAFHFVPGVTNNYSLGEYLINESYRYSYSVGIGDYIDYERFGADTAKAENGIFIENYGYVGMADDASLDEILEWGNTLDDMSFGGM